MTRDPLGGSRSGPDSLAALLAAFLWLASASTASGALPDGAIPGLKPVWPEAGAVVQEAAVRFAWNAPSSASRHVLLLSRAPFDTREWTRLPSDPDIGVHPLERPVGSLDEAEVSVDRETRLYWAGGSEDRETGRVFFTEVRSCLVIPRFTNRVEPSPYLRASAVGRAAAEERRPPRRVRLESGYTFDPLTGEPAVPDALRGGGDRGRRTYIVHYGDADPEETRREILRSGGSVVSYIPDHAFLVRAEAASQFSLAGEDAWVGAFHPAYKLSPRLDLEAPARRTASVLLFPDGDPAVVAAAARSLGAEIAASSDNGINKIMRVSATGPALARLALDPDVAWIEPYVSPGIDNSSAQWVVQTNGVNNRRLWDMGLRGEGQVVMTSDTGIDMTHDQFRDPAVPVSSFGDYPTHRKVIAYKSGSGTPNVTFGDGAAVSYHGTHTAGTAAGTDDPIAFDSRDGIAKYAKLYFMDLWGPALGGVLETFPDLNDLYRPSYVGNGGGAARISSNSWGAPVNGAYTIESLNVDQFVWNHPDYLMFFSNGNSGAPNTVRSPATSKNTIGAGATGNGTSANTIASFTSRGPVADGRRKPTITAPGSNLSSARSGPSLYQSLSGTSMSCPAMAGAATLIRQYVTQGWYPTGAPVPANAFTPSAALLKAMCINAADNDVIGFQAPDNNIGYGRINADSVLYFPGDARKLLLVDFTFGLGHLQWVEYQVDVVDGNIPLEVSLCWSDYPGSPSAGRQLVNDLNLTVSRGGAVYLGNVYAGGFSTTGGAADGLNVEEAVRIASPPTGLWTIRITGSNVPLGPQPFGLCITGGLGTNTGTIALDRASYGSGSTVRVRVLDANAGPTVDVNVASTTEPAGETVTLAGTGGVYDGSIPLSPYVGATGDGAVQVSNGDLLTARYDDTSPVATVTARAEVSLTAPLITGVRAFPAGNGTVLVEWDTDRSATSRVYYGPTAALGSQTPLDPLAALRHQVRISELEVGRTYFYAVESQDLNGNLTRDDNGGTFYRFTVSGSAEVLLLTTGSEFERMDRYASALGALGWSYDVWQGPLSDTPEVGDATRGMRSYVAVWLQTGLEEYPPLSDAAREAVKLYLSGGGRLAVVGHDIAWSFGDAATSPFYSPARRAWLEGTLRTVYNADPSGWTAVTGIPGDPISGAYTGGVPYFEHRSGASGDEIDFLAGDGTAAYSWRSGDLSPDDCGLRWESDGPRGTPGTGFWAGSLTRLATMYFEWSGIDPSLATSGRRNDIMAKTFRWLLGRDRPTVALTGPADGSTITADSAPITWTEATAGGTGVSGRTIEYSPDGGTSWVTVATGVGPSPYVWDLSAVANTPAAIVRVRVADDGAPPLAGAARNAAPFAIRRPAGDAAGPVVVAGSIRVSPNPVDNRQPATLTAGITDAGSGGGNVAAAEWSFGDEPAPAGAGVAMTGGFGAPTVGVGATLDTGGFPQGQIGLWVRGRDDAGNWGPASVLWVVVNGSEPTRVDGPPTAFELRQNAPNPVRGATEIAFAVPAAGPVRLEVYDVRGRRVRELLRREVGAGMHRVAWDLADESGRRVEPGLYYYRLTAAGRSFERRLVALR